MFARAIMSWVMAEEDNSITRFIIAITDPIIIPIRMLLEKFEFVRNMPIDISFFVAFLLLAIIQNLLPPVF
jgi:YGGT family.